MSDRVRPFSQGTQFMDWMEGNCCECKKCHVVNGEVVAPFCDLEEALSMEGMFTGTISREIADRLGVPENTWSAWECREKEPEIVFTISHVKGK